MAEVVQQGLPFVRDDLATDRLDLVQRVLEIALRNFVPKI